jgi:hypothetical protein
MSADQVFLVVCEREVPWLKCGYMCYTSHSCLARCPYGSCATPSARFCVA